jgi:PAS domain-containing protein
LITILADVAGGPEQRRTKDWYKLNRASAKLPGFPGIAYRLTGGHERRKNLAEFISPPAGEDLRSWCKQSAACGAGPKALGDPCCIDGALDNGFPVRVILRAVLPGSNHLLLCIEDGVLVKRAEERTHQLEAELSSLLDALEAGVILFDPYGRIRFANARFGQLFSLNLKDTQVGRTFGELESLVAARVRDPETFSIAWKQFAAGDETPSQDELELVRPARRVLERYSRPVLSRGGSAAGWLELYYDVTGSERSNRSCCRRKKWRRSGNSSPASLTS